MSSTPQPLNPKTAIEKFLQNGKPGLGRFASCVATSTKIVVFGLNGETRAPGPPVPSPDATTPAAAGLDCRRHCTPSVSGKNSRRSTFR